MHNKSLTADNQLSILGGRNIGDAYFDAHEGFVFDDLDVLLAGPAVDEVSTAFDRYWNHDLAYPIGELRTDQSGPDALGNLRDALDNYAEDQSGTPFANALSDSPLRAEMLDEAIPFGWDQARVIYDDPEKLAAPRDATEYHMVSDLAKAFRQVRERITIISPYFVPGEKGLEVFRELRERGITVRILTNALSSNDVPAVHAGYAKYRRPLLEAGVELFELRAHHLDARPIRQSLVGTKSTASLHAKAFVFDRESVFIGSLNLDPRSITENSEIGVLFRSPLGGRSGWLTGSTAASTAWPTAWCSGTAATRPARSAGMGWAKEGNQEEYIRDPGASIWLRMGVSLLGLLPVEPLL